METLYTNLTPFFAWLLRTTLQGSLLVALIALIRLVWRRRLPVQWHYGLWLILLVRLSMPWAPACRLSVYNLFLARRWTPAVGRAGSIREQTPPREARSGPGPSAPTEVTGPAPFSPREAIPVGRPFRGEAPVQRVPLSTAAALSLLWLTGAVLLAGYILVRNFGLWWTVRQERVVTDQQLLESLEDAKMQMGVQTVLGVVVTDKVRCPALFGFVRPRLLLPQGLLEALSPGELHYVFLHELAHLKRWDICLAWWASALAILHWFNPLVWWALSRMRADQEMACDALALSRMTSDEPRAYGLAIVSFLKRCAPRQHLPSVAGILEDASQIERRMAMISQYKPRSPYASVVAALVFCLLAAATLTGARELPLDSMSGKVPTSLQKDVLLYYSFDRNGGARAVDVSGMDFHGQVHGGKYTDEGRLGGAMGFDGDDDYIRVAGELQLGAFTVAAWVRAQKGGLNNRRIFMLDQGREYFAFEGNTQGGPTFSVAGGTHDGAIGVDEYDWQLEPGRWTHVAVVFTGSQVRLYRNGVRTETGSVNEDRLTGTAYVGGVDAHNGGYWQGDIDELAVFSRGLADSEMEQLYAMTGKQPESRPATPPVVEPGRDVTEPVACWRFDGDARDSVGHNHGQVHGATPTAGVSGQAYAFDGQDDYVEIPNVSWRSFSVGAWVKTDTPSINNRRILLLTDGVRCYALQGNVGGGMGVYVADDVEVNEYDWEFATGRWTHIVLAHDGKVFRIFKNGALTEEGSITTAGVTGTLYIGGTDQHRGRFWQGAIDEVSFWRRPLSPSEVKRLFDSYPLETERSEGDAALESRADGDDQPLGMEVGPSPGPVGIWRFDGDARDSVGNMHGSVRGATLTEGVSGQAYAFDGQDDCIVIPNISLSSFTFAASVQTATENLNNRRLFLLDADGDYCALQGTTREDVELSGPGFGEDERVPMDNRAFETGTWIHVAATFDGDRFAVYRDGQLLRYGRNRRGGIAGTLYIGGTRSYRGGCWHGAIDEVILFDRALSAAQVKDLCDVTLSRAGRSR
ncbi:MAG: hypothetical protein JSW27_19445 [Phycisphaerales bacterium]|nr:MAG: hypothetical protein JSW27_19445 [Phycisphaerales bacterium]